MKLHFKNLPSCGLPYDNDNLAMSAIVKLYEKIPYLPDLQNVDSTDSLLNITLSNVPCIVQKDQKILFYEDSEYKNYVKLLDAAYENPTMENLEYFKTNAVFIERYFKALSRINPQETVIRFYGPFSLMYSLSNKKCSESLIDRSMRKFFVQMYIVKAQWFINKIQSISSKILPIIIFEEPLLNKFSSLKRHNESIESDLLVDLYKKIFDKLHKSEALVGIQCFEKCDWKIVLDADADIISFDAYHNPHNLNIISSKINEFLQKGGVINWGIVPMDSADVLTKMNSEFLYDKLIKTIDDLVNSGVESDLVYDNSLVSVVGDIYKLPLIFSEKALLLANKIAVELSKN